MIDRSSDVEFSAIVPVCGRRSPVGDLYAEYKAGLEALGQPYEMIFVLDGPCAEFEDGLKRLLAEGETFTVISLTRPFGEATAIMAGFEFASAQTIVTLPAYQQIEPTEIAKLVAALGSSDVAIGRRWPRAGGALERMRRAVYHGLLALVTHRQFQDLGCGARALDRRVLEEIQLYGDQHRFLALLADRQGFRVREVDVRQSPRDRLEGTYGPRVYTRGLLDIFSIVFLVRFTKRPLRFFGMIGSVIFATGALTLAILVVERLFLDASLADRPALLLASLLVVLGMQLFAVGLLGELMIFTHARGLKDYQVERVIQFSRRPAGG